MRIIHCEVFIPDEIDDDGDLEITIRPLESGLEDYVFKEYIDADSIDADKLRKEFSR